MAADMSYFDSFWGHLKFASDATQVGMIALGLLSIAALSLVQERRRARRTNPDAVGYLPWTTIFVATSLPGMIALFLAVQGWLSGR